MSQELAALSINETIPIAATSGSMSDRRTPKWVRMAPAQQDDLSDARLPTQAFDRRVDAR